jgi:hypothetical protein
MKIFWILSFLAISLYSSPIKLKYAKFIGAAALLCHDKSASSFITPNRKYVFSNSNPPINNPATFHLYESSPLPPIDNGPSILTLLDQADEEFLYVKSSRKVLQLLGEMKGGEEEFKLNDDKIVELRNHLLSVMLRQAGEDWTVSLDGPAFLPSSLRFVGGKPHVSADFHQDGAIGKRIGKGFLLNVWIATRDATGYPLAFVRSESIPGLKGEEERTTCALKYDPAHQYVYVPGMKAGESLIFKGSDLYHGSPTIPGTDGTIFGEREAIFQRFLFLPRPLPKE